MGKKRPTPEQIVMLLRQIEVATSQGKSIAVACREAEISDQSYRDELLNGEIFYSLKEAQVLIEQWRRHYNTIRPHSALGYTGHQHRKRLPQSPPDWKKHQR